MTEALRRTIQNKIDSKNLPSHATVHFILQSDAFSHAFQSTTFTVQEFTHHSDRLNTYLSSLANKLNSNQDFNPDDSFTLETTFIRTPGSGSGGHGNKPGRKAIEKFLKDKRSIIAIKNLDELCCARAIVTMKAREDHGKDSWQYENLKKGLLVQERMAKNLHLLANVPEGPCGIDELQVFQDVLPDYQIRVMSVDKPHCVVFEGPDKPKKIHLVKVDDHYHGCNSFKGFLDTSYFCLISNPDLPRPGGREIW